MYYLSKKSVTPLASSLLLLLAASSSTTRSVEAFTTPRSSSSSLGSSSFSCSSKNFSSCRRTTPHQNGIVLSSITERPKNNHHRTTRSSNGIDHSLKFWKKDDAEPVVTTTSIKSDETASTPDVIVDNGRPDFIAPTIYAGFTGILIYIIYELRDAIVTSTLGTKALALVTGALIWDNLIITIGSIFFRDVEEDPTKYQILKTLSWPRFTLHAVGTPLQCITVAEMGKAADVGFLQSDLVQIGIVVAAIALAIQDRQKFVNSPGLTLTTYEDSPFTALERDLVKFTYKEPLFAYVIPAIILAVFNLVVGIAAMKTGADPELSNWLFFAAATALVGNALPGSINTFSGNLGECGMQYGLLQAARIVYGGGL